VSARRHEPGGKHEPAWMVLRRPRRRVQLDRTDGQLIMSALADAAAYRQLCVQQWCSQCDSASAGTCDEHLRDGALIGAYRVLAEQLADVLPVPEDEAGL
jgi:hypothetical protein